jgi:hypothetical protein
MINRLSIEFNTNFLTYSDKHRMHNIHIYGSRTRFLSSRKPRGYARASVHASDARARWHAQSVEPFSGDRVISTFVHTFVHTVSH